MQVNLDGEPSSVENARILVAIHWQLGAYGECLQEIYIEGGKFRA
jgi:hypothetical protein